MTKYIMMALFYAGSVMIAYCLGYRSGEKWQAPTGAQTPTYRRHTLPPPLVYKGPPMPPVKPARKEPNPNYTPPASVKKAERDEFPEFMWRCPICISFNHVRRDPICWWCGFAYVPDEYPEDEEAVE